MKDEIKEILDKLQLINNSEFTFTYTIIQKSEAKALLNYITNLQKENEELQNNQKYHKNNVFSLEYDKETLVEMCNDLQEENEYLKKENKKISQQHIYTLDKLIETQTKIENTISYIKEEQYSEPKELYGLVCSDELLKILGDDKDENN